MAILKEFRCAAHGAFEATEKVCPHGCAERFVVQEIRTAPAYHNGRTQRIDKELNALASSYGMTNMRNDKDSGSVMDQLRRREPSHESFWKDVPHSQPGWTQRQEAPAKVSPAAYNAMPDNVTEVIKPTLVGPTLKASKEAGRLVGTASVSECQ
jgi:hypothetical protein